MRRDKLFLCRPITGYLTHRIFADKFRENVFDRRKINDVISYNQHRRNFDVRSLTLVEILPREKGKILESTIKNNYTVNFYVTRDRKNRRFNQC